MNTFDPRSFKRGPLAYCYDIGFTRLEAIGSDVIIVDDARSAFPPPPPPMEKRYNTGRHCLSHSAFYREMLNVTRLDDRFSFSLCSVLFLLLFFFFFSSLFFPFFFLEKRRESMRIITDNKTIRSQQNHRCDSWNIDFSFFLNQLSESRLISLVVDHRKLLNQDLHSESISLWFFIRLQMIFDTRVQTCKH